MKFSFNKSSANPFPLILVLTFILAVGLFYFIFRQSAHSQNISTPSTTNTTKLTSGISQKYSSLAESEVQKIFARLEKLSPAEKEQSVFKLPHDPLPPPKPGTTINETFPPKDEPLINSQPSTKNIPLEVLRYAPQGLIPAAPFINVTFNQDMVPLSTLEVVNQQTIPVQIEPKINGSWRWLGTKTLTFEHDDKEISRLPNSTKFTVRIPAGVASQAGNKLTKEVLWHFSTPTVQVIETYPQSSPQPLSALIFVAFNQKINPDKILPIIKVINGDKPANIRLASPEEINNDATILALSKKQPKLNWVVIKALEDFTPATNIKVEIGPNIPSAEGELVTKDSHKFGFSTYSPFVVYNNYCRWHNKTKEQTRDCQPLTPMTIEFNNSNNLEKFNENWIKVSPNLPNINIINDGYRITIRGQTKGQTTYTVTVAPELEDIYGQKLNKEKSLVFSYGKASPLLLGSGKNLTTLDPFAPDDKKVFSLYVMNYDTIDLSIYQVEPENWWEFEQYLRDPQNKNIPGKKLTQENKKLEFPVDTLSQWDINLSPYLKNSNKTGHFIVIAKPPPQPKPQSTDVNVIRKWEYAEQRRQWNGVRTWVQVTQMGLTAITDDKVLHTIVNDLKDGTPLAGVEIKEMGTKKQATSQKNGLALISPYEIANNENQSYLIARKNKDSDSDSVLLPNINNQRNQSHYQWFVFDDRGMYRPGEEVHLKGWVRNINMGNEGDVELITTKKVKYSITDAAGNKFNEGELNLNAFSAFDLAFKIPEKINLGSATINIFTAEGFQRNHQFQIQEFRRPEFEVKTKVETPAPFYANEKAQVSVSAKYYAGGGLPNAETYWVVTSTKSNYSPPKWEGFTFGSWRPYWFGAIYPPTSKGNNRRTNQGLTDANGSHILDINIDSEIVTQSQSADSLEKISDELETLPINFNAQATVMDVNRQAWSSSTNLLVHPAKFYIGIRSPKYFVERGAPILVDYIVSDIDGKVISGKDIVITAGRIESKYNKGKWLNKKVALQTCVQKSADKPATCEFKTEFGGEYEIIAKVRDDEKRLNQSRFTRWVSGGDIRPSRNVELEKVIIIPDREKYQVGESAKLLIQSPFGKASGVMFVTRGGIINTENFNIGESGSTSLSIPILDKHLPNLDVQIELNGANYRLSDEGKPLKNTPPRPAFASGKISLPISLATRTLNLEVHANPESLSPGGESEISVLVRDNEGKGVSNTEVALVAVDEAILALSNYLMQNPVELFYANRRSLLSEFYSRSQIILQDPLELAKNQMENREPSESMDLMQSSKLMAASAPAPMMAKGRALDKPESGSAAQPIAMRTNFNPLAIFAPQLITNNKGEVKTKIKLPDNLTRYRIMAVAVDSSGKRFGKGESNLTARLPLMVRPSAPRFLNFGDKFELPVIVQNQTDKAITANVVARANNLKILQSGFKVTIPANDRVEVRFPVTTDLAGTTSIQIAAVAINSGIDFADSATVSLPIYTPATTEAFATYGVVDKGAITQSVEYPKNVFPQYGALEISTSSTALQALTDAVLYLYKYPFEYSEQRASKILAIASLRDVLGAFNSQELPTKEKLEGFVLQNIKLLQDMQNSDGGFPYWQKGRESIVYNSIHATYALVLAKKKGFAINENNLNRALKYINTIENKFPEHYGENIRNMAIAYALYVRAENGDVDTVKAEKFIREKTLEKLSIDAIGWLWHIVKNEDLLIQIRKHINNRAVETAGMANFTTAYLQDPEQKYLFLSSDRKSDAIVLNALIHDNSKNDLIPKIVKGLTAHKKKGRWNNTQENLFVLIALDKYFQTYEKQPPDFVARLWLGDSYLGENKFIGYSGVEHQTNVPISFVQEKTKTARQNIIIDKNGTGRLYYRLGLRYAPTDLNMPALDMGFVVERKYEAIDNPEDVRKNPDGKWEIKAGAQVRVHLKMSAQNRRYHVALIDPLPAGLEIVNPALAVSGSPPTDKVQPLSADAYGWWWWRPWFEHQNLRDNRAEAFTSILWDGVFDYSYIARATTPGTFIVPPTKAEEMYSPEVFGRSAGDVVVIK